MQLEAAMRSTIQQLGMIGGGDQNDVARNLVDEQQQRARRLA